MPRICRLVDRLEYVRELTVWLYDAEIVERPERPMLAHLMIMGIRIPVVAHMGLFRRQRRPESRGIGIVLIGTTNNTEARRAQCQA